MSRASLVVCVLGALVFAQCSGSNSSPAMMPSPPPPPPPAPTGNNVSIAIGPGALTRTTDAFGANPVMVAVGATVVWTNGDSVVHDATSDNGAFATGSIGPGAQASVTFAAPGRFPYTCTIHPNMVGTIVVQ